MVFKFLKYKICFLVGDECRLSSTGKLGKCKILADCPIVEEQARAGISPTICGFYHHSHTIVCCESIV